MKLEQTQTMQLHMTVQLRQAIDMLQYSIADIHELIEKEIEEHPLIEYEAYDFSKKNRKTNKTTEPTIERFSKDEELTYDDLVRQAHLEFQNTDLSLVLSVLPYLKSNGYLEDEIPLTPDIVNQAIPLLQQIGPAGIGARSAKECLRLQAIHKGLSSLTIHCIDNHLEALARGDFKGIAEELQVDLPKVRQAMDEIRTLHPYPCHIDHENDSQTIVPDITIKVNHGEIQFSLHPMYTPKLSFISPVIPKKDAESKAFLEHQKERFHWLQNSLMKRKETLTLFVETITKLQYAFFAYGKNALQPMTMKQIAEQMEMHESTVSRITTNKFIATPHGTFPLKELFQPEIKSDCGQSLSRVSVQATIEQLIAHEDPKKPLSDQKIATTLQENYGIQIARRTVHKYRELLLIPTASRRRV